MGSLFARSVDVAMLGGEDHSTIAAHLRKSRILGRIAGALYGVFCMAYVFNVYYESNGRREIALFTFGSIVGGICVMVAASSWRGFRRSFSLNLFTVHALSDCHHLNLLDVRKLWMWWRVRSYYLNYPFRVVYGLSEWFFGAMIGLVLFVVLVVVVRVFVVGFSVILDFGVMFACMIAVTFSVYVLFLMKSVTGIWVAQQV
jgi:hypothetical protein